MEELQLLCPCSARFPIGMGERGKGPWSVPQPKTFTKQLAAWYDEHQGCSLMRFPARPAIMVGVQE